MKSIVERINSKLQNQMLVFFLPIVLIPVIIISGLLIYQLYGALTDTVNIEEEHDLFEKSESLSTFLQNAESDIELLGSTAGIQDYLTAIVIGDTATADRLYPTIEQNFLAVAQSRGIYDQVRLLDAEGNEVVRIDDAGDGYTVRPQENLQYKGDRSYFTNAAILPAGEFYISPLNLNREGSPPAIEIDENGDTVPVIRYALPVYITNPETNTQELGGVVVTNVFAEEMFTHMAPLENDGETYLVNSDGYFLYNSENPNMAFGFEDGIEAITGRSGDTLQSVVGEEHQSTVFDANQDLNRDTDHFEFNDHIFHFQSLVQQNTKGTYDWHVLSSRDRDVIYSSVTTSSYEVTAIVALLVVLATAASVYMSRSIIEPVVELSDTAKVVAGGDFSTKLKFSTRKDELGELERAFSSMQRQLANKMKKLDEHIEALNSTNHNLRVATARAKEAARVKSEFLATMSHELRTPLNAIIGFSDMLLVGMSGPLNEKQSHKITRLQENGKRLLNLINDILDITRIEAGRIELNHLPVQTRDLATRIGAQVQVLADEKDLIFTKSVDNNMPETLYGDEKRLEQIIVNLLSNAFKFTEKGGVTLSMKPNKDASRWIIKVTDTGIGIPPHAKDLIFEEFRQIDGSSTRAYQGSGLGLSITQQLVRTMGGTIKVDSELGKGSIFTVELPLLTEAEDEHLQVIAKGA